MPVEESIVDDPVFRGSVQVFANRADAGKKLARLLEPLRGGDAIVLGIPAGGVPVAVALAEELELPIDVAVVSKMTLPWDAEAGYGAVAFDGTVQLNEDLVRRVGLTPEQVQEGEAATRKKVKRRQRRFRGKKCDPLDLTGRTVILVDDGLASGFTMRVAVEAVRRAGAARIVVAVPTAHEHAAEPLARTVDGLYVVNLRRGFRYAVADAYERWRDVTEDEALEAMGRAAPSR